MQVLVLGGCGSQGRAALYDLSRNESVDQVTCERFLDLLNKKG